MLMLSVLALGVADSVIGPYLVLYGTQTAHLTPLQAGLFMSVISVGGLAVSTWLGRRYDRAASRWPALVAVGAPAAGYAALTTTSSFPVLLIIGAVLLSAGTAGFPQIFALARTHYDRLGGSTSSRRTPALRSIWSLAWAAGPIIGGAVLAAGGYHRLLQVTALTFGLVAVPLLLLGRTPRIHRDDRARTGEGRTTAAMLFAAAGFTCFHTAMLSGSVVLPLYVTGTLHQSDGTVGLLFTVCALVEIPVALATMMVPARVRKVAILAGMLALVGYFLLVAASTTVSLLIGTQVARGIALASAGALGITYVQDLAPDSPGRATTLFTNTVTVGSLLSGLLAGVMIQAFGFRAALLTCAALALCGCGFLMAVRHAEAPDCPDASSSNCRTPAVSAATASRPCNRTPARKPNAVSGSSPACSRSPARNL
jgi:MFS transporter, SET family, sugar efflux transporter